MSSLNEIKKKIKIVESTSKITNAMKLVATSKLKKQKQMFENESIYCKNFYDVFSQIYFESNNLDLFSDKKESNKTIWILVFSNMGLCGSFNLNIVKELEKHIKKDDELIIIGKKGRNILKSKSIDNKILLDIELDDKNNSYDLSYLIGNNIFYEFKNRKDVGFVNMLYTKFENSLSFISTAHQIFPLDEKQLMQRVKRPSEDSVYTINANSEKIIESILPDYMAVSLFGGILESKVCENASRRNAMESATKNADELIKNYRLEFNRKRQSDITQEITEIVSGSNLGE